VDKFEMVNDIEPPKKPMYTLSTFFLGEDEYYFLKQKNNLDPIDQVPYSSRVQKENQYQMFSRWRELQNSYVRDQILEGNACLCVECGCVIPFTEYKVKRKEILCTTLLDISKRIICEKCRLAIQSG